MAGKNFHYALCPLATFVLLQLSTVAWLFLAVGASQGGESWVNKSMLGSSFLPRTPVNPSSPVFLLQQRISLTLWAACLGNERWLQCMYSKLSSSHQGVPLLYHALPHILTGLYKNDPNKGNCLLCPVSHYLSSWEVVVVNNPKVSLIKACISLDGLTAQRW